MKAFKIVSRAKLFHDEDRSCEDIWCSAVAPRDYSLSYVPGYFTVARSSTVGIFLFRTLDDALQYAKTLKRTHLAVIEVEVSEYSIMPSPSHVVYSVYHEDLDEFNRSPDAYPHGGYTLLKPTPPSYVFAHVPEQTNQTEVKTNESNK